MLRQVWRGIGLGEDGKRTERRWFLMRIKSAPPAIKKWTAAPAAAAAAAMGAGEGAGGEEDAPGRGELAPPCGRARNCKETTRLFL